MQLEQQGAVGENALGSEGMVKGISEEAMPEVKAQD